jgi:hypothetical protein
MRRLMNSYRLGSCRIATAPPAELQPTHQLQVDGPTGLINQGSLVSSMLRSVRPSEWRVSGSRRAEGMSETAAPHFRCRLHLRRRSIVMLRFRRPRQAWAPPLLGTHSSNSPRANLTIGTGL